MPDSHMSRRGPTLSRILSHGATEQGEELAHITLDRELRFRTWDEESSVVASGLKQFGITRGEVVGLAFDGRGWLEMAVAYIGVHRAGATCLLMNHAASPAELRAQVSMLGAVDAPREGLVLELLGHRLRLQVVDAVGTHQAAGVD